MGLQGSRKTGSGAFQPLGTMESMTTPPDAPGREPGYLDYYRSQGISPVRYRMANLDEHLDRRDAVYRSLGLPQVAFRGCKVLEVAPGSGQNSLFIAQAGPSRYDLVEPNPAGIKDIQKLYGEYADAVVLPNLHTVTLEDFTADTDFDVVICENWLGSRSTEQALIGKLASLVAPGGVLVLTLVPLSGFSSNVLRRLLALRINNPALPFEEQTDRLVEAFGPHLGTIPNMTRSHEHWVQDCMLNPHYLNVVLPFDTAREAVGDGMEVLGSAPKFATDWRWFKGLVGAARRFNGEFARNYAENIHNFVDYRHVWPPRDAADNALMEDACRALHTDALAYEAALVASSIGGDLVNAIAGHVRALGAELHQVSADVGAALDEFGDVWAKDGLTVGDVAGMGPFARLFGRETVYVAFTRQRA